MGLNRSELLWIVEELEGMLLGSVLAECRQPSPSQLLLNFRIPGGSHWLLIAVDAGLERMHLVGNHPPNPLKSLSFQNLLRARLRGRLREVALLEGDRVVKMSFGGPEGIPEHHLLIGLTGRGANLFLLDAEMRVQGTLRPLRGEDSLWRVGEPWRPPPLPAVPRNEEIRKEWLNLPAGRRSLILESWFEEQGKEQERKTLMANLDRVLRNTRRRLARKAGRQAEEMQRGSQSSEWQKRGELLAPVASRLPRGLLATRVTDWGGEEPVEVVLPLLPHLDGRGNVARCFHTARRFREGAIRSAQELARTEGEVRALERLGRELNGAVTLEDFAALWSSLPPSWRKGRRGDGENRPSSASGKQEPRLPFHVFQAPGGQPIWAGKSAADNDAMTFHHARGNDLWFHARGRPGAHVVVPQRQGAQAGPDLVRLAAQLALKLSRLPEGERWEVSVTAVKHVRKVKGAPGKVTFTQERVWWTAWQGADLAALTREGEERFLEE